MENWLPAIPSLLAIGALWWKITTDMATMRANMATKDDIRDLRAELQDLRSELQADIRELRQMIFTHIGDHSHDDSKQSDS